MREAGTEDRACIGEKGYLRPRLTHFPSQAQNVPYGQQFLRSAQHVAYKADILYNNQFKRALRLLKMTTLNCEFDCN